MSDQFAAAAPEPVDPDDALADLEAIFQGEADPEEILVVQEPPPPLGKSWAFDFVHNSFRLARGAHGPLETHELGTLIGWAEKCLRTTRGAHPVHPPGYGMVQPGLLIGQLIQGAPVAELEERIRDALTFHPRISDIQEFTYDFDTDQEWIAISFRMILDDDTIHSFDTTLTTSDFTVAA